jgi:hypothetical protein
MLTAGESGPFDNAVGGICSIQCMLHVVYAVHSVCFAQCMLKLVNAILGVYCTRWMLYSVFTLDHGMKRWRGMT